MRKFSTKKILKAIENSGGIISTIAKRLGCDWMTARRYIDAHIEAVQALKAEQEAMLDMAESNLLAQVQSGDFPAVKFYLMTKGKERGYTYETSTAVDLSGDCEVTLSIDD